MIYRSRTSHDIFQDRIENRNSAEHFDRMGEQHSAQRAKQILNERASFDIRRAMLDFAMPAQISFAADDRGTSADQASPVGGYTAMSPIFARLRAGRLLPIVSMRRCVDFFPRRLFRRSSPALLARPLEDG